MPVLDTDETWLVNSEKYENDIISIWYTAGSYQDGSAGGEIAV